jgi:hypothetical protein
LAPSKDELVVAVMRFRSDIFLAELEERLIDASGGRAQIEAWVQYAREQKNAACAQLMDDAISFRPTARCGNREAPGTPRASHR